jgi:hypothetical protein
MLEATTDGARRKADEGKAASFIRAAKAAADKVKKANDDKSSSFALFMARSGSS